MLYLTYNEETRVCNSIAYNDLALVYERPYVEITEEYWSEHYGKELLYKDGKLIVNIPIATQVYNLSMIYDDASEAKIYEQQAARGYTKRSPSSNDYLNSPNARWKQDALDWIAYINETMEWLNNYKNTIMAQVYQRVPAGGELTNDIIKQAMADGVVPTVEDFLAEMPLITWTYQGEL